MAETAVTVLCMVAVLGSVSFWVTMLVRGRASQSASRELAERLAALDTRLHAMSAEVTAIHRLLRDVD
jgi:hypothetical protein